MIRQTPGYTPTDTLFPDPTLFRSPLVKNRDSGCRNRRRRGRHGYATTRRTLFPRTQPNAFAWLQARSRTAELLLRRRSWSHGTTSRRPDFPHRSEEHTSELQSLMRISYAVLCLKKTNYNI